MAASMQKEMTPVFEKHAAKEMKAIEPTYGLARCTRCGIMYDQSEAEQQCRYHPGEFTNRRMVGPAMGQWTCCGEYQERAVGCKTSAAHVRCVKTAESLDTFPQVEKVGLRQRRPPPEPSEKDGPAKGGPPPDAVKYTCGVGDTVKGVALKHRMSAADLKKWNKLLSGNLFPGLEIYVRSPPPPSADEMRAEALRLIQRRAGCTEFEASYYLDECGEGKDPEAALAGLAADARASDEGEGGGSWVVVDSPSDEPPPPYSAEHELAQ